MFGMSMWEILVVLGLLFVVVGPGKLPGLAKKLGEQIRGLKDGLAEVKATVDADDEFVKAVSEARRTVVEAKEAVREIIDDVVSVADDRGGEVRDRAPRPVPKGRKLVSSGRRPRAPRGRAADGPQSPSGVEPVEIEDLRHSSGQDDSDEVQSLVSDNSGPGPDDPGGLGQAHAQPAAGNAPGAGAVAAGRAAGRRSADRRPSVGRRMVKPGRDRVGDGK